MSEPVYSDAWLTIHLGDCRTVLAELEPESVDCVVTSPPYWGLRDYGLPPSVWGGELDHQHDWGEEIVDHETRGLEGSTLEGAGPELAARFDRRRGRWCPCGAWLGCLGLEPRPEQYVEHMVEVFAAVRRVLRKRGTVWLNLGDGYADRANGPKSAAPTYRQDRAAVQPGKSNSIGGDWRLKAKDRLGIPHRVVFALQAAGWWWRDEVIWHKPNPQPSSVADRTTPAHEMLFLLTRSARYEYDAGAIREAFESSPSDLRKMVEGRERIGGKHKSNADPHLAGGATSKMGRRRSVGDPAAAAAALEAKNGRRPRGWNNGATSEDKLGRYSDGRVPRGWANGPGRGHDPQVGRYQPAADREAPPVQAGRNKRSVWTIATQPYPGAHFATFPERLVEPCLLAGSPKGGLVLDPFAGSGTVGLVAQRLGRRAVLVDLSGEYLEQAKRRTSRQWGVGGGPAPDDGPSYAAERELEDGSVELRLFALEEAESIL